MVRPMDGAVEKVARGQNGLFTAHQARDAGATEKMVRHRLVTGRWLRAHAGVFALLGTEMTPTVVVHAAVLATGGDAVASHATAAALLGVPGFALGGPEINVTAPSYTKRRRSPARIHATLRLPAHHRRTVAGVPCTSVARTLFDLCGDVHPQRAERAVDNALARRMVLVPALWRVLDDHAARGRSGSVVLRRVLMDRGGRYAAPESELEARFVELVRSSGLPQPDRQVDLGDADSCIGRVDFVCRDARVIIEVDGALAHTQLLDRRADTDRDRRFARAGWTTLRFSWADVTGNGPLIVAQMCRALGRSVAA